MWLSSPSVEWRVGVVGGCACASVSEGARQLSVGATRSSVG